MVAPGIYPNATIERAARSGCGVLLLARCAVVPAVVAPAVLAAVVGVGTGVVVVGSENRTTREKTHVFPFPLGLYCVFSTTVFQW